MKNSKLLFILIISMFIFGCEKQYKVNCSEYSFQLDKERYSEGETVTARFDLIATDTDYTFYLDGEYIHPDYDGGYIITFTMPDHDVELTFSAKNSMIYDGK